MGKRWFLFRLVVLALFRRKSRVAIAFTAIVLGVAIVSALANVYYDVGQKMTRELRTYGANLVISPASPETQPYVSADEVSRIAGGMPAGQLVGYDVFLFGVANFTTHRVLIAGTDFEQISLVNPYWKITGGMPQKGDNLALIGEVLAKKLKIGIGDRIDLTTENGQTGKVTVSGVLSTGDKEDNIIFLNLDSASKMLGKAGLINEAYFSVASNPEQLEFLIRRIQSEFPNIDADTIKQISVAEGKLLTKIQSLVLLAVGIILLLTLLCLTITMMNIALQRRREIGLRKALGGHDRDVLLELVIEGCVLGLIGGAAGWLVGLPVAQGIGQSVFHASITVRLPLLPLVLVFAAGLAGLAAFIPARIATKVQPAIVLRDE